MAEYIPNSRGIQTTRKEVSLSEILDMIVNLPRTRFVTFGYFRMANLYKKKSSVNMNNLEGALAAEKEKNGDKNWYKNLSMSIENPSKKFLPMNVIKITRYTVNWMTPEDFNKAYANYNEKLKAIRNKYGVPEKLRDAEETDKEITGSSLFGGEIYGDKDHRNKLYTKQNGAKIMNKITMYYFVDENGNISEEMPYSVIMPLLRKSGVDGATKVVGDLERKGYEDEVKLLNGEFMARKFMLQRIMFINATANGQKVFWINDEMIDDLDGLHIDTSRLMEIARGYITESSKRHNTALYEINKFIRGVKLLGEGKVNINEAKEFEGLLFDGIKTIYEGKVGEFIGDLYRYVDSDNLSDNEFYDEEGNLIAMEPNNGTNGNKTMGKIEKLAKVFGISPLAALTVIGKKTFDRTRDAVRNIGKNKDQEVSIA